MYRYRRLLAELAGVEVAVRLRGPVLADKESTNWKIRTLLPLETAHHTLQLRVCGYGLIDLICSVALSASKHAADSRPLLPCRPLHVSMATLLRPPPATVQEADFFRVWDTLPAKMEQLSGTSDVAASTVIDFLEVIL